MKSPARVATDSLQIDADNGGCAQAQTLKWHEAADCMKAPGIGKAIIWCASIIGKSWTGYCECIGLTNEQADYETRRLTILRAMDKYDRLGLAGVRDLLGAGRRDESGDFTAGAGLNDAQIDAVAGLVSAQGASRPEMLDAPKPKLATLPQVPALPNCAKWTHCSRGWDMALNAYASTRPLFGVWAITQARL